MRMSIFQAPRSGTSTSESASFNDISFAAQLSQAPASVVPRYLTGPIDDLKIAGVRVKDLLDAYKKVYGALPETPLPAGMSLPHH